MVTVRLAGKLLSSQLRRNIATGMGSAVLNIFVGLATYPVYLHFLGLEKYGIWLAMSTVLTFAQLGNFGINPAVTKLVAEAYGAGNMLGVRRCLTTAWLIVSAAGVAIFSVAVLLRGKIPEIFNVSGPNALIMSDLVPYVAVFSVGIFVVESLNATLVGLGRMDLESWFRIISQIVSLGCSFVLLANGYGIPSVLAGNAAGYLAMHFLSMFTVRRIIKSRLLLADPETFSELPKMLRFGGWVSGVSLINIALNPFNRIVLSRYAGIASLPLYDIAYVSAMRVRGLLESGIRAMMPEISRIASSSSAYILDRAKGLQRSGLLLIAGLGAPVYVAVILLARPLLHAWLRSQFQPGLTPIFRIMLVASFLSLLGVPGYYILLGLGKARACFLNFVIMSGANVFFVLIAWLFYGVVSVRDVALGIMFGMGLGTCYIFWQVMRLSHLKSLPPRTPQEGKGSKGAEVPLFIK